MNSLQLLSSWRGIEFHEQTYCPRIIREAAQSLLTLFWTVQIPYVQKQAPFELAVDLLREFDVKGDIVDFCSGAGGPVPFIEREFNSRLEKRGQLAKRFKMSDLYPHVSAWKEACRGRVYLSYIPTSTDATNSSAPGFRTFYLAFHHLDDIQVDQLLRSTREDASGIAIFELQQFTLGNLFNMLMLAPLSMILTPFYRPSLLQLVFTYIFPIIPVMMAHDGCISCWRTRSHERVRKMLEKHLKRDDKELKIEYGSVVHTWPFGKLYYMMAKYES